MKQDHQLALSNPHPHSNTFHGSPSLIRHGMLLLLASKTQSHQAKTEAPASAA